MKHETRQEALIEETCVKLGFCGSVVAGEPRYASMRFPVEGQITADDYLMWVFWAEDVEPTDPLAIKYSDALRKAFVKVMGAATIDVTAMESRPLS